MIQAFWKEALPSWEMIFSLGPLFFLLAWGQLFLGAHLKKKYQWRTGYSRKTFHFLVFFTAGCLQWSHGLAALCLYGFMVSFWVGVALLLKGNLASAMVREEDAPHGRWYVILPWFSTFAGGVVCNVFFGETAVLGYWIVGICDAIAEPVGIRWGRHPYRLRSIPWLKSATRTFEGSVAIFLSALVVMVAYGFMTGELNGGILGWCVVGALGVSLVEAFSPHGADNFTLQLFSSAFFLFLM